MPEARDAKPHASTRRASERGTDLAAIDALIDRLVPALTAKLASTHLGELEVREGEWRIRLRRPPGAGWNGELRRASDRAADRGARGPAGHEVHGHARATVDSHRAPMPGGSNGTGPLATPGATAGTGLASAADLPAAMGVGLRPAHEDESRRVATSPAVGVFRPGARAVVGTRVREGDPLGHVDVLGVSEEVPAPADGVVAELIVEAGTAVEYGQELLLIAAQPRTPLEVGRS